MARMLCRVLLAAIALSYLVCVLFLSGIQKEDLDVSLLKKMQHYSIDFDKNNEELRKECQNNLKDRKSNTNDVSKTTNKEDTTTTEITTTITSEASLDTSALKSVLKYLKHKKKIRIPTTTRPQIITTKVPEIIRPGNSTRLFDKLMSENDDNINKNYDSSTRSDKKDSSTEEMNKYLNFDKIKLLSPINNTNSKTLFEQTQRKIDKVSKEIIKDGKNDNNFKNIEQIGKALAEYFSKNNIIPISSTIKPDKGLSERSHINTEDIEHKLASSIAAINKLNENIAILQKHINREKITDQQTDNKERKQANESMEYKGEKKQNGYGKGVIFLERQAIQNLAKPLQVDKLVNFQGISKLTEGEDAYGVSKTAGLKNADSKIFTNPDNLNNTYLKFGPEVNNSINILASGYDKQRYFNLHNIFNNVPNNFHQYDSKVKESVAPNYNYDKHTLPKNSMEEIQTTAYSPKISQFEYQHSKNMKEYTNYSFEKQRVSDQMIADSKKSRHEMPTIPYIYQSENLEDITNYDYYNRRLPENRVPHFQYNIDVLGNGFVNGEHPETHSYNTDKILPRDINIPVAESYGDVIKHTEQQYPYANLMTDYSSQKEPNTHSMDVQSSEDVFKNKQTLYSLSPQNIQDSQIFDGDKLKQNESHKLKFQENTWINKTDVNQDLQKDQINSLSYDIINKIANSVKEIVLKDLKKEIFTSTTFTTHSKAMPLTTTTPLTTTSSLITVSTTMSTTAYTVSKPTTLKTSASITSISMEPTTSAFNTTTIPPVTIITGNTTSEALNKSQIYYANNVQVATQAIENLIQLFEQIKSGQGKTIISPEKNTIFTGKSDKKPKCNVPIVMFSKPMPVMNTYGVKIPPNQMPLIVHHYIPPTPKQPPFLPSYVTKLDASNSMSPIYQTKKIEQQHFPDAFMIQTNTHEIQPLGVPVIIPETLNTNIILTTRNPFWSRDDKDRWNYMFKYGRSPDKKNDLDNTMNKLNAYSNAQVASYIPGSKVNNNITNNINVRMSLLKQFDVYNKQENLDKMKNAIQEIRDPRITNNIILQGSRYKELETGRYQTQPTNVQQNNKNTGNLQAYMNQITNQNGRIHGIPYNSRVDPNPILNLYKNSRLNSNINNGQLQNEGFINSGSYRIPEMNVNQEPNANVGLMRHGYMQNNNYRENAQIIPKSNIQNELNIIPLPLNKFNANLNGEIFRIGDINKNMYLKATSDTQIQNINTMPFKETNDYSNEPKSYRNDQINKYNMLNREMLQDRIQNINNPRYLYNTPLSYKYPDKQQFIEDNKHIRTTFHNPEHANEFSGTMDRAKSKLENTKYYSSDDELNHEYKLKPITRPIHGINANTKITNELKINRQRENEFSRYDNNKKETDNRNEKPQIDLINAVFGHRNRLKNKVREHGYDSDINNHEYKLYAHNSYVDTNGQEPHGARGDTESNSKYAANVRGFHEKLESSGWPSDCGPNERCESSVKILSRQQLPLDSKKPAKYDDTHFKNFLKTQQKVNQMLEMILASKADEMRSVETA